MKKKFIFLPGDMELNIEDTSCPSNKTSNWRYTIIIVEPGIIGFVLFLDFHFHNNQEQRESKQCHCI